MLKRPHSDISSSWTEESSYVLPLTRENLRVHTLSTSSQLPQPSSFTSSLDTSSSMASVRSSSKQNVWDTYTLLQAYRIDVDTDHELPPELQVHLDTVLLRDRDGPRSPNARSVVQRRFTATYANESTGIWRLEPFLLFDGEDGQNARAPVPKISRQVNLNLSRDFLPPPPPNTTLSNLPQPQPDTTTGYLCPLMASKLQVQAAFTIDEQLALADFTLNPSLLFPFLTSQWKPATGESFLVAHHQSARDGSAIIRYLDEFYGIAYGRPATVLECAHVSFTCDMEVLNIWLHWRELDTAGVPQYYMKSVFDCTLRSEENLLKARELLKNHLEYALGSRLNSLKAALPSFATEYRKRKFNTKSVKAKSLYKASHQAASPQAASPQAASPAISPVSSRHMPRLSHDTPGPSRRSTKRLRTKENSDG